MEIGQTRKQSEQAFQTLGAKSLQLRKGSFPRKAYRYVSPKKNDTTTEKQVTIFEARSFSVEPPPVKFPQTVVNKRKASLIGDTVFLF